MQRYFHRHTLAAVGLLVLYFAVGIAVFLTQTLFLHHWLVWNVFLAMLPAVFAWLFLRFRVKGLRLLLAMLWLVFFPNAPYLVTDMMHVAYLGLKTRGQALSLYPWLTLMQVGIAIFLSLTMGLWSLSVMHKAMRRHFSSLFCWSAVGVLCLLGGYGVYLGRFLRLNSWDVLHPPSLFTKIFLHVNRFSLGFSVAFGLFIFFTYCIFCTFRGLRCELKDS